MDEVFQGVGRFGNNAKDGDEDCAGGDEDGAFIEEMKDNKRTGKVQFSFR